MNGYETITDYSNLELFKETGSQIFVWQLLTHSDNRILIS